MPKLGFLALLLFLTLNVSNAMFDYNILNIRFELVSEYDSLNWDGRNKDLITPQDLINLQDKDYNAFGIPLPKQIIVEVLNFHKNHNDEFSLLVKQYPFSQLIFSQWQTIKLYEKHKELTQNPKLKYRDFMQQYFSFTYNGKNLNIYEAIAKMKLQERNNASNESYDITSYLNALDGSENLSLYDFVYDIIPNSIKREFLKDESTMKSYLPLKRESFEYTQNNFKDKIELHKNIYGDKPFNENNIKKQWHTINALNLKGYDIDSKELIIPKAKHNKLGIAYNEIWELINVNQNDLELPKFWDFKRIGWSCMGMLCGVYVLDKQFQTTWNDIGNWARETPLLFELNENSTEEQKKAKAYCYTQHYQAKSVIIQNNFMPQNGAIFENYREQQRTQQPHFNDYPEVYDMKGLGVYLSAEYVYGEDIYCYLAYRFNQALALAFVGAYHKGE